MTKSGGETAEAAGAAHAASGVRRSTCSCCCRGNRRGSIWLAYRCNPAAGSADKIASNFGGLYRLLYNKYYVDQIYDAMFVNRIKDLALTLGALTLRDQWVGRGRRGMADPGYVACFDGVGFLDRGWLVNLAARSCGS